MRRYGLYDATHGVTTALAAGVAGLLLWAATRVGQPTTGRFWAEMGIVAAAGLVMTLSQVLGGWTKGLRLRLSPGTFALAFAPVLVCVGWILMASQPGRGWQEGTIVSWSRSIGLLGLIHDLALWHGVLAFGFGLVLGLAFDTVPALVEEPAAAGPDPLLDRRAADEPVTAELRAAPEAQRRTAPSARRGVLRRRWASPGAGAVSNPCRQGSGGPRGGVDSQRGMNADLPQTREGRGLGLLRAQLSALDPDAPTARERLEAAVGPKLARMLVFALSAGAPRERRAA